MSAFVAVADGSVDSGDGELRLMTIYATFCALMI